MDPQQKKPPRPVNWALIEKFEGVRVALFGASGYDSAPDALAVLRQEFGQPTMGEQAALDTLRQLASDAREEAAEADRQLIAATEEIKEAKAEIAYLKAISGQLDPEAVADRLCEVNAHAADLVACGYAPADVAMFKEILIGPNPEKPHHASLVRMPGSAECSAVQVLRVLKSIRPPAQRQGGEVEVLRRTKDPTEAAMTARR